MIDKQAVEKMTEMLALIKKYGKLGTVEVETDASSEYRRRAWAITKMLSKLTEHAAESDFYFLLSDRPSETDKERHRCYQVARQEDRAFMTVLREFDQCAKQFADEFPGSNEKTDTQLVHEIELLTTKISAATANLEKSQRAATEKAAKKKIKDVPAFVARDASVISAIVSVLSPPS